MGIYQLLFREKEHELQDQYHIKSSNMVIFLLCFLDRRKKILTHQILICEGANVRGDMLELNTVFSDEGEGGGADGPVIDTISNL